MAGDNLARKMDPGGGNSNRPSFSILEGSKGKEKSGLPSNIVPFPGVSQRDYSDLKDASAAKDYSNPTNQMLAGAESKAASQFQKNPRDISQQENETDRLPQWMTNLEAKRQNAIAASKNKQNGFFSRHKKGMVGGLIGLVAGGGMFFMAGILSGPTQLLQIYRFFEDTYNTVHNTTIAYREGRISASLVKGLGHANEDRVVRSRLGVIGRNIAKNYQSKMAQQGIYLELDGAGRPVMRIDPGLVVGNSQFSLKDPNEAGISSQEKYRRQQAIRRVNAGLQQSAEGFGVTVQPVSETNPTIRGGNVVVDIEAPKQGGAIAKWIANSFFRNLNRSVGMGTLSGEIGMRAYSTKAGFVNAVFHPVQAAKTQLNNFAYDKVTSLLSRLSAAPEQARANALARMNTDLESQRKPETGVDEATARVNQAANAELDTQIKANTTELDTLKSQGFEPNIKSARRGYLGQMDDARATVMEGRLRAIGATTGILAFVISLICGLYNLANSGMADAFVHTVLPAVKLAGVMTNVGSQMMTGDLSMDDVGAIIKAFVYDDKYPVTTDSNDVSGNKVNVTTQTTANQGHKTTENAVASNGKDIADVKVDANTPANVSSSDTITSSFWNACTIQSESHPGYQCSDKQKSSINGQLADVAKGTEATTIKNNVIGGMNSVIPGLGTAIIDTGLGALCSAPGQAIVTILSVAVTGVVAFFTGDWTGFGLALAGAVVSYAPGIPQAAKAGTNAVLSMAGGVSLQNGIITLIQTALGPAMDLVGNGLESSDLDWITSSPEEKGNIAAYGAYYNAQLTGVQDGGVILTPSQQTAWNIETNTYLAEQFNQKPLLAKLFDPTDYRSMVATLGHSANVDPDGGFFTQLANTAKMFGALPNLAFASFFNSPANAVMAAAGVPAYNYNVPTVAVPLDVLNDMNNMNDPSVDVYNNAGKVSDILNGSDGGKYDDLAKVCLGKAINHDDLSVTDVDPTEGETGGGYGITFYYMAKGAYSDSNKNCSGLMNKNSSAYDENFVRIATYAGLDWGIVNSQGCYYGDAQACAVVGVGGTTGGDDTASGSSFGTPATIKAAFDALGGSFGGYRVDSNGCTTIPLWFIETYTNLRYGRANGGQVASQLVAANPNANPKLEISSTPKAPAVFSTTTYNASSYCGGSLCGHTGLVLSVDGNNMTILETGAGYNFTGDSRGWSIISTVDWTKYSWDFVYVGDHLKSP